MSMTHPGGNQPAEAESREIIVREQSMLAVERAPDVVLEEASRAASALKTVLDQKPNKVMMGGEQYLEFEDWQTLGRFYGVTAKEDGDAEYVEFGGVYGFRASAVALTRDGQVVSRATAFCLSDEPKWSARTEYAWGYVCKDGSWSVDDPGKDQIIWEDNPQQPGKKRPKKERRQVGNVSVPLFQLSSMAQTRACAKALRNVLSWVAVLAGYRPTPAEEMDEVGREERSQTMRTEPAKPTSRAAGATTKREPLTNGDAPRANGRTTTAQRSAIEAMLARLGRTQEIPEAFEAAAEMIRQLNDDINGASNETIIEGEAREIPATEPETQPTGDEQPNGASDQKLVCAECGEELTDTKFRDGTSWTPAQLAAYGNRKHGRVLCMADYKRANDAAKLPSGPATVPA